jgi:hypothetical protein
MVKQPARNDVGVKWRINFFEIESTIFLENTRDLAYALLPVFQVVDDAKVEYSIHAGISIWKLLGVANEKKEAIYAPLRLPFRGQANHSRINIQCIQPLGLKGLENYSSAGAAATAYLQTAATRLQVPQPFEESSFSVLDHKAQGAVHKKFFGPVDFHLPLCPVRGLFSVEKMQGPWSRG